MEPKESATPGKSPGTLRGPSSPLVMEKQTGSFLSPDRTEDEITFQRRHGGLQELQAQYEKDKQLMEERFNQKLSEIAQYFSQEKNDALKTLQTN